MIQAKFHEIAKITLTPKVENPRVDHDIEYEDIMSGMAEWRVRSAVVKDDWIFPAGHWQLEYKMKPSRKLEKVAKIVGYDKAIAVLEVLE